jgi:hypothetical protein
VQTDKPHSCERHSFCDHNYKMLDYVRSEEQHPLPLPVPQKNNKQYMNETFSQRHFGQKNRILIDGKVKQKGDKKGV